MVTMLTVLLWFFGLVAILAGHPFVGAAVAGAAALLSIRALRRRDDMEHAFGCVFLFVLVVNGLRIVTAALPAGA